MDYSISKIFMLEMALVNLCVRLLSSDSIVTCIPACLHCALLILSSRRLPAQGCIMVCNFVPALLLPLPPLLLFHFTTPQNCKKTIAVDLILSSPSTSLQLSNVTLVYKLGYLSFQSTHLSSHQNHQEVKDHSERKCHAPATRALRGWLS